MGKKQPARKNSGGKKTAGKKKPAAKKTNTAGRGTGTAHRGGEERRGSKDARSPVPVPDDKLLRRAIMEYIPRGVLPESEQPKRGRKKTGSGPRPSISVEVRSGFVLLRGTVSTVRQKERIYRFVMGLSGVRAVKNLLHIAPTEAPSDLLVAGFVRQALDAHAELFPGTVSVHIRNGICRLRGYVETAEQKHVAEHVAEHCRGVKSVVNEIEVDPLDRYSDQATSDAVRGALDYCAALNSSMMTVSCADGVVVLRGRAPTLFDRALAEELARIQGGVRTVENHIQVVVGADRRRPHPPETTGKTGRQTAKSAGAKKKRRSGVQARRAPPMRY